jgi:hypothetical protein
LRFPRLGPNGYHPTHIMKKLSALLSAAVLSTPGLSAAWTHDESNRTVATVGVHYTTTGFLILVEPVPTNCQHGNLYFDIATPLGKALFATLMTAKTTGQKVRVGYTVPAAAGLCTLELAALAP